MNKSKAVFLDRDGTINIDPGYIGNPDDFKFYEKAKDAIKLLKDNGFKVFVVTNQSGIGRGYFTEENLTQVHAKMLGELKEHGVFLDDIYYCYHRPDENCSCRKPSPELVLKAAKQHNVNLQVSYFVGDKFTDVMAGKNAGCKTVLISDNVAELKVIHSDQWKDPDCIVSDLFEASKWIINKKK